MKRGALLILAVLAAAACDKSEAPTRDAGEDLAPSDTPPPPSDVPVSLAVDFAVENCPSFDAVALTCTGSVPLAVRFVPLATTTVTNYRWEFGDGSLSASEAAPSHVYDTPGVYTVTIIATGVNGGVVTKAHAGFIVARAKPFGAPCDTGSECDQNLFCLCPAGAGCSTGAARGMCVTECSSGFCDADQACAGLRTATPPPAGAEPWQRSLCLPACNKDSDCTAGLRCRTLPPDQVVGTAWVHACFADVPRDIGEPCMDAGGNLRNDLCASGQCVDLGALGMCSSDCQKASCPPDSDCALFGDGRKLCLRPCTSYDCASDALLTCIGSAAGDLGYHLADPGSTNAGSSYCAPKSCASDGDCLPNGTCAAATGSGHCVRR